jgi:hypothetical protein
METMSGSGPFVTVHEGPAGRATLAPRYSRRLCNRAMSTQPSMENLIAKIRALKPELEARFQVESLALFGSYARHAQTAGSDLDVLVSFREVPSLLLKPNIGRHIRAELVPV